MEKFNSLSGWSGQKIVPGQVNQKRNYAKLPTEYDITFKNMMAEVFGWSGSVMDVVDESGSEPDDSSWQNNEDPEAPVHSEENAGLGSATGDTTTDQEIATNGEIGGNLAAGTGNTGRD